MIRERERERRKIKPPQINGQAELVTFAQIVANEVVYYEPRDYREVVMSKEADKWMLGMNKEIESLYKKNTQVWVEKSKKIKVVESKSIFKRKEDIPGLKNLSLELGQW